MNRAGQGVGQRRVLALTCALWHGTAGIEGAFADEVTMLRTFVISISRAGCLATGLLLPAIASAAPLELTPPQIEGPYYPVGKPAETDPDLTRLGTGPQAKGTVLVLSGMIADPAGVPIEGAVVEIWQADHQGIYWHPREARTKQRDTSFQFFAMMTTDGTGAFAFRTVLPGRYGGRPPHLHMKVKPPGGPVLTTQLYFQDDPDLARDAFAAELGKALERLLLAPKRPDGAPPDAALEARITLVVKRQR